MMKSNTADGYGSRFVAAYGFADAQFPLNQKLTPAHDTVEAVMADLARRQTREGSFCFAQIIDLSVLEPVEPYQATLARLRDAAPT